MELHEIQKRVMALAKEKEWGTKPDDVNFAEKIALLHAELSEALEAYRKNKLDGRHGVKEEIADTLVRVLHLAGIYEVDVEKEVLKKLDVNQTRDWKDDKLHADRKA